MVRAVTGGEEFYNNDHLRTLSEERHDMKEAQDVAYKSRLKGLVSNLQGTGNRPLLCTKSTGAWPSVHITKVSVTVLSATEFRNFYVLAIMSLP